MAGFNWFRRAFDKSDRAEAETPPAAPQETEQDTSKPDSGEATAQQQLSPEDYLKWAKAAYQNIQQQQTTPGADSPDPDPAIAAAPDPETEQVTAAPADPIDAPSNGVIPEPGTPEPETPEPAPPSSPAEAVEPLPTDPPSPPVPFWARAEEERQQRLERLKETAIVEPEPEPEPEPVAAVQPQPVLPADLDLDEAFLWSAEVLAAQGRRAEDISVEEITWLNKLRQGLDKTRRGLINQLKAIVGQGPLNDDAVMEIEALLLQADVGVEATDNHCLPAEPHPERGATPRPGDRLSEVAAAGHAGCPHAGNPQPCLYP
jgi:fused signal recognition particle receptor